MQFGAPDSPTCCNNTGPIANVDISEGIQPPPRTIQTKDSRVYGNSTGKTYTALRINETFPNSTTTMPFNLLLRQP